MLVQVVDLPPALEAPGVARGAVADVLAGVARTEAFAADCALLVSEVVTNAVLHGGGEVSMRCLAADGWVRVEVRDGSPIAPAVRDYGGAASTGRGVELVDVLSSRWGVAADDSDGKTVWFELGERPAEPGIEAADPEVGVEPGEVVVLVAAPLALLRAAIEYADAVLREVAYLALGGGLEARLPTGWRPPELDMSPLLAALSEAPDVVRHDLVFLVSPGSATGALDRLALVELADALAREGELLARPAVPELAACRAWWLTEIASQLAGSAPTPWEEPDLLPAGRDAADLEPEAVVELDAQQAATVVADDANRIIYANAAAHVLLDWDPTTLVGQRLTAIIPPHLRHAHLAGFTRLQLGGPPRILDRPTVVPALRHDGTTVEVRLTVTALGADRSRTAYRASLEPRPRTGR